MKVPGEPGRRSQATPKLTHFCGLEPGPHPTYCERKPRDHPRGPDYFPRTIERSIDEGHAYRVLAGGRPVGGLVEQVGGSRGTLDLLFIAPEEHSKGYGQAAWALVEDTYPAVTTWETFTPYFETRNVHFYVNKLGFEIVEFFNLQHPHPHYPASQHGAGGSSAAHEDFLFMKTLAKKPVQAEVQRVRYADKGQLHQLINLQGLKACRYGQDADGSGWLELR